MAAILVGARRQCRQRLLKQRSAGVSSNCDSGDGDDGNAAQQRSGVGDFRGMCDGILELQSSGERKNKKKRQAVAGENSFGF